MFTIEHVNFQTVYGYFDTLEIAKAEVVRMGFDAVIVNCAEQRIVMSWSIIGGWRAL